MSSVDFRCEICQNCEDIFFSLVIKGNREGAAVQKKNKKKTVVNTGWHQIGAEDYRDTQRIFRLS